MGVDLTYKCGLIICSWAMLYINTCIRMCKSMWNTVIDVEHDFWRNMFTVKPAKSAWSWRQPCLDFLCVLAVTSPFMLDVTKPLKCFPIFTAALSITIWIFFPILHSKFSIAEVAEKEKATKWKCAFQIYLCCRPSSQWHASDVKAFDSTDLTRIIDLPVTNDSSGGISLCYFRQTDSFGEVL